MHRRDAVKTLVIGVLLLATQPRRALALNPFLAIRGIGFLFRGLRFVTRTLARGVARRPQRVVPRSRPHASQLPRSRSTTYRRLDRRERQRAEAQIQREVKSSRITTDDMLQVAENAWDLMDMLNEPGNQKERTHFEREWSRSATSTESAREHVAQCRACGAARDILTRGTDLIYEGDGSDAGTGFRAMDQITVIGEENQMQPQRQLHLPPVPTAMRTTLRGKELVVRAGVDLQGRATIISVSGSAATNAYVAARAKAMVTGTRWSTPRDTAGRRAEGVVRVVFRWE